MTIELKRNKKTGLVEAWENGKKVGKITTMGDHVIKEEEKENGKAQHRSDSPSRRS